MSVVGLITEYNPFHNGHLYHIKKAKERTGADQVVVIMSGDYVQRGAPAFMPKHLRTKMALECGASLVLELPNLYSCASAEAFAFGSVSILNDLGVVDYLCFGSEAGELDTLQAIASCLISEPSIYQEFLKKGLKEGKSYPLAREQALLNYMPAPDIKDAISNPNNILGIEYLKALTLLNSKITPVTIKRRGASYNDAALHKCLSSATAIRELINREGLSGVEKIKSQVPLSIYKLLQEYYGKKYPITFNDYSLLLKEKLLGHSSESLLEFMDISEDLANKIMNNRNNFLNTEQFITLLKTKDITYSRISRSLLHIILNIKTSDLFTDAGSIKAPSYVRVLGFKKEWSSLLSSMKQSSSIPVITKLDSKDPLPEVYGSDLYESVVTNKYQTPFINEYQKSMLF